MYNFIVIDIGVILQKYGDFGIAVPQGKKC